MKHILLLFILAVLQMATHSQPQLIWADTYTGNGNFSDVYNHAVVTNDGGFVAVGYTMGRGSSRDALLVKVNSAGQKVWEIVMDGVGNGDDELNKVVVAADGSIVAAGYQDGDGTGDDAWIVNASQQGDTIWTYIYDYLGEDDQADDLAADLSGGVVVTGTSDSDVNGTDNKDVFTLRLDGAGILKWTDRYDGTVSGDDRAAAIVSLSNGNLVVAGRTEAQADDDCLVICYDTLGSIVWMDQHDGGGGDDRGVALAVDALDNIYIAARSDAAMDEDILLLKYSVQGNLIGNFSWSGASGDDCPAALFVTSDALLVTGTTDSDPGANVNLDVVTIKYSLTGGPIWVKKYDGSGSAEDMPNSIVVDNYNNVFVGGFSSAGNTAVPNTEYLLLAYDVNGASKWTKTLNNGGTGNDACNVVAMDDTGALISAGTIVNPESLKDAILFRHLNSGVEMWRSVYAGTGDNYDNLSDMILDPNGNLYYTGYTFGKNYRDILTVKVSPIGDTLWTAKYNGSSDQNDEGVAIARNSIGEIIVGGYARFTGASYNYMVLKYSQTGILMWSYQYNHTASGSDKVVDLILDESDNIYVTGRSENLDGTHEIATIKLNSGGSLVWSRRYQQQSGSNDEPVKMILLDDRIALAATASFQSMEKSLLLVYDTAGTLLWHYFSGNGDERESVSLAADAMGNIYLTGERKMPSAQADVFITACTENGNLLWDEVYDGVFHHSDSPGEIIISEEGVIYVAGESVTDTLSGLVNYDYLLLSFETDGTLRWSGTHDYQAGDDEARDLTMDPSGRIWVTGRAESGGEDVVTLIYQEDGTLLHELVYSTLGAMDDYGSRILSAPDGSVYVGGASATDSTQRDALLLKYQDTLSVNVALINPHGKIILFPNPVVNGFFYLQSEAPIISAVIVDQMGRIVIAENKENITVLHIDNLAMGVYTAKMTLSSGAIYNVKLIKSE